MHTESSSSGTSTPVDPVEGLLLEVLACAPEDRDEAADALCRQHPELAEALRRRYRLLGSFSLLDDDDDRTDQEHFGRFRLVRRIGTGTAEVYLAFDEAHSHTVALKVLPQAALLDPGQSESLRREAWTASRIDHPGICRVFEVGDVDGVPYLSMEFVPGPSLADWLDSERENRGARRDREAWARPVRWIRSVAEVLHVAHCNGLVHRDVKPHNILLRDGEHPVLIDFGVAQELKGLEPACLGGTLAYASPELLADRERPVGPPTDVYSLGATLYECLTLRRPHEQHGRRALQHAILSRQPTDPRRFAPHLPRELVRVLRCAMAKEAWARYATAAHFAEDLDRVLKGEPIVGRSSSVLTRVRGWVQRNRYACALGLVLLAALIGVAALAAEAARHDSVRREVLRDLDLMATAADLEQAKTRAAMLVPAWPSRAAGLEAWLREFGEPLRRRGELIRRRLAELGPDDASFVDETLSALAEDLAEFSDPDGGLLSRMRERLDWSRRIGSMTLGEHAEAWQRARDAVASDPRYAGLELAVQMGLVPLGPDPRSGLQEFYHLRSAPEGAPVPGRDPVTGDLVLGKDAGIVFVLIPRGAFLMGAQSADPSGPNYMPGNTRYSKLHTVELDPFFLAKHEITRAQWERLSGGERPSYLRLGGTYPGNEVIGSSHPVENVSATQCDLLLGEHGLRLPTEAQWEYACRAGSSEPWPFGREFDLLTRHANILDSAHVRHHPELDLDPGIDDGFVCSAPVGSLLPNAFGLHDMLGNVAEWCRDHWVPYDLCVPRPGDGLRTPDVEVYAHRVFRGGSYRHASVAYPGMRNDTLPERRTSYLGMRAARALYGEGDSGR